jgi:hypothetical protein
MQQPWMFEAVVALLAGLSACGLVWFGSFAVQRVAAPVFRRKPKADGDEKAKRHADEAGDGA